MSKFKTGVNSRLQVNDGQIHKNKYFADFVFRKKISTSHVTF